jgi:ribosomal protein S18 acetylase RimI-like enzyme
MMIRKAQAVDVPRLVEIEIEVFGPLDALPLELLTEHFEKKFKGESTQDLAKEITEEFLESCEKQSTHHLSVIESNGVVLGFERHIQKEPGVYTILDIAISKHSRRLGLGKTLLRHVLKEIENSGGKTVQLKVRESNGAALTFYRECGFTLKNRIPKHYINGDGALILERAFSN